MPVISLHPPVGEKVAFFGLTFADVQSLFKDLNLPGFRAKQVFDWVYAKHLIDLRQMSNVPAYQREQLLNKLDFGSAEITRHQRSEDGTQKLLLSWPGGAVAETVMIPDADRRTACVSSQVGCPVGCTFCASGVGGAKGNLSASQIVEQVLQLNSLLEPQHERITNVVFMGMGEPLANYANVMQAIRVLHEPMGLNIGARRITLSTVGVPARMRELASESLPINLAISLHAPNEALRKKLIPWAEHFSLDDILDAARFYFDTTGREITLEYILLAGVNDQLNHAQELARLCRTLRANVNLIRYNQVEGLPYGRPLARDVEIFQDELRQQGVNAHVRKSRGRDIDAACGQLRRKQEAVVEPAVCAEPK